MDIADAFFAIPVAICGLLLLWAGLGKLNNPAPLANVIARLGVAHRFAGTASIGLVVVELATVLVIVSGISASLSSALLAILGLLYAGAGAWNLLSGKDLACACFGASERQLGWPQLALLPVWLFAAWSATRLPEGSHVVRFSIAGAGLALMAVFFFVAVHLRTAGTSKIPESVPLASVLGQRPSDVGLPAELDSSASEVAVYLDKRCRICNMIADSLNGNIPHGTWLVFLASTAAEAASWIDQLGLASSDTARVIVMTYGEVVTHLPEFATPLALSVVDGRIVSAVNPSVDQFYAFGSG